MSALDHLRSLDRSGWEPWRRGVGRWLPALAVLVLAVGLFVLYQGRFAGRAEVSAQALTRGHQDLARLDVEQRRIEGELTLVGDNRRHLDEFYASLATERERLTRVIAEIKELARRCGLDPQAISYPEQELADSGLRKRSFVFSVSGTYPNLRKLVNLLELSDSFLTLERVDLTGGGDRGAQLRIDLTLSTLFVTPGARAEGAVDGASSPAAAPAAPAVAPPAPAAAGPAEVGE